MFKGNVIFSLVQVYWFVHISCITYELMNIRHQKTSIKNIDFCIFSVSK